MDASDLLAARARTATSSVIRDLLHLVDRPGMLSLAGGLPAPELLPAERIVEAVDRVVGARSLQYGPTEGMGELREVVAERLGADPSSIVITTGSQQAVDLLARVLIDPGDLVVVESPGYLGSLQVFGGAGARIVPLPGDACGLAVEQLAELLDSGVRPKLVSVVTDFANPTGATLSLERRRRLVELAARFGFVVVEDNPYGELRWAGERPPSTAELDGGHVAALGSASKILAPGLRIGWMRGPGWLTDAVVRAKQSADLQTSSFDQLVAADVLGDASFMAAHLAAIRGQYRLRSDALVDALEARLGDRLDVERPDGGMFLWARRRDGGHGAELFAPAIEAGVAFVPGDAFVVADAPGDDPARSGMRLCFTTLSPPDLAEAVARLASVMADGVPCGVPQAPSGDRRSGTHGN